MTCKKLSVCHIFTCSATRTTPNTTYATQLQSSVNFRTYNNFKRPDFETGHFCSTICYHMVHTHCSSCMLKSYLFWVFFCNMHHCSQTKLNHTPSFQQLFIILISARSFAGPLLNARTLTYYRNGGWGRVRRWLLKGSRVKGRTRRFGIWVSVGK